jgi:bile acid:Na+ symporter, BASS family
MTAALAAAVPGVAPQLAQAGGVGLELPPGALVGVNVLLAVIMVGVALELDLDELRHALLVPLGPLIGLVAQVLVLPAASYLLIRLLDPPSAIALGMLIVACAPGGAVSNIVTHLARANASLSIALTGLSTSLAAVTTPFNLAFWGSRLPSVDPVLRAVALDPLELFGLLLLVLALPVGIGVVLQLRAPGVTRRLIPPLRVVAALGLLVLVVGALLANAGNIITAVSSVAFAVIAHNALGLLLGDGAGRLAGLPRRDQRALALEVGMQNTALALTIALTFFGHLPQAALVAAFWGIWHVLAGLLLARVWSGAPLWRAT